MQNDAFESEAEAEFHQAWIRRPPMVLLIYEKALFGFFFLVGHEDVNIRGYMPRIYII